MKKEVVVISLGGSQIIHDNKINVKFLLDFKKVLKKHSEKYKFVVVCGGGSIARMYIEGLQKINSNEKLQSFAGISITRANARFMNYFFSIDPDRGIPHRIREVRKQLIRNDIIFCGALEYHPNQTSDSTAAQIASYFKSEFINITNIDGLYDNNPLTNKNAKFIPFITWKDFNKIASKIKFKPGQHFVLDQKAAKIIMENKTKTYIIGQKIKNLELILQNKKFRGTLIFG
ncbi:MAG: UMP kinase [Candidatus Pacearchaeota archaeon]